MLKGLCLLQRPFLQLADDFILFCFIDFDFDLGFELALALEKEEVNKKFGS